LSSLLDIDLDYFAILDNPVVRLNKILNWGNKPVSFIIEKHNQVIGKWKRYIKKGIISNPTHILHVDEHHDMMDEKNTLNIANILYHAMIIWPYCRVHWLVDNPIDSPEMWLSDDGWNIVSRRFSNGHTIPESWPKPDLVSICTSPGFIAEKSRKELLRHVELFNKEFGSQQLSDSVVKSKRNETV
jgi:hypothetical protein